MPLLRVTMRTIGVLLLVTLTPGPGDAGEKAPHEIPDVAEPGTSGYLAAELIYGLDDRPTPQCHASTLVETSSGLVAAWFGGRREKAGDVGVWVSRHTGGTWSTPVEVADGVQDGTDYPCWNPVLFQPEEGPLLLFYKVGPSPSQWWGMLLTSQDDGKTWSAPRKLGTSDKLGDGNPNLIGPVKNKPVQLADGPILCPSSTEHDGWRVHFEIMRRDGKTGPWKVVEVVGPINDAERFNAIQPTVLTHGDGTLQVLCRTQEKVLAQSFSTDGGQSWSELTATELPNPNAGADAVTLADGRHLLVYNHTTRGGEFPSGRQMLNVALSSDGRHWKPVLTLERQRDEHSYPAVIQTADDRVHATYTYHRRTVKHVVLDPAGLE